MRNEHTKYDPYKNISGGTIKWYIGLLLNIIEWMDNITHTPEYNFIRLYLRFTYREITIEFKNSIFSFQITLSRS